MSKPRQPDVDPSTFFGVDMRVGQVVEVHDFPEARVPARKLTVDFGPEIGQLRTSAHVTNYSPEELLGRHVIGVVNIGTRQIGPFRSEFLVLGSITDDDTVLLLDPAPGATPGDYVA